MARASGGGASKSDAVEEMGAVGLTAEVLESAPAPRAIDWRGETLKRLGPSYVEDAAVMTSSTAGGAPAHMRFNSCSFSDSGRFVCAASEQGVLSLVDAWCGKRRTYLRTSLGSANVRFTHDEGTVLYAARPSVAMRDRVGLVAAHSTEDNVMVRLFRGHSDAVTSIACAATGDWFLTGSLDGTFRVWDPRKATHALACGRTSRPTTVAADPSGQVVLVAARGSGAALFDASGEVAAYDIRKLGSGPFAQSDGVDAMWKAVSDPRAAYTDASFSADGNLIALSSPNTGTVLLDAFSLQVIASAPTIAANGKPLPPGPSASAAVTHAFSANSALLFTGGHDGYIYGRDVKPLAAAVEAKNLHDPPSTKPLPELPPPQKIDLENIPAAEIGSAKHSDPVTAIAADPNAAAIASVSNRHFAIWGLA